MVRVMKHVRNIRQRWLDQQHSCPHASRLETEIRRSSAYKLRVLRHACLLLHALSGGGGGGGCCSGREKGNKDGKDISGESCGGKAEGLGQKQPPAPQNTGKAPQIPPILLLRSSVPTRGGSAPSLESESLCCSEFSVTSTEFLALEPIFFAPYILKPKIINT